MTLDDLAGRRVFVYLVGDGAAWAVAWRLDHAFAVRGDQRLEVPGPLLLTDAAWHLEPERLRGIAPPGERLIWAVLGGVFERDPGPRPDGAALEFVPRLGPHVDGALTTRHPWAWLPRRPDGGVVVSRDIT